jgi:NAD(P)-dependent dehydrogenase (short-subunit alcohol dehydrogenase family)
MLSSPIALVTGGSRGLGKDMALRLAEKGNDVIITYQSQKESAEAVVETIIGKGRKAVALHLDMADTGSLDSFVNRLQSALQEVWQTTRFDFLVNNAGMGSTIMFRDVTEADFDLFMNVHFKNVYFLTQKSLPLLKDGGRIINISSGSTQHSVPGYSVYASMKGAVEVMSTYLAKELGPRGITVNVVAPGPIETDFNNAAIRSNPDRKKMLASTIALGRVGTAEDIGGVVAFLCSADAGWINGQRIEVAGGLML